MQTTRNIVVVTNCVLNVPLILLSIFGNALVVATMARTPSIRSPSMTMLCSLAVSDLLVGFVAQPLFITSELITNVFIKGLSEMMQFALCGISLCTMTAISVDRFLALHYPMKYQATMVTTPRIVYGPIITIWIANVSFSGLYFWRWTSYFSITAVGLFICILISTYTYIKIYQIVRKHQARIQAQQRAAGTQISIEAPSPNMLRIKRSAINTFIFYVAMILCYIPIIVSLSLASISYENWTKTWHFADTVTFLNSSMNPFLYCWRLADLRTAVIKTLRIILCRKTNDD